MDQGGDHQSISEGLRNAQGQLQLVRQQQGNRESPMKRHLTNQSLHQSLDEEIYEEDELHNNYQLVASKRNRKKIRNENYNTTDNDRAEEWTGDSYNGAGEREKRKENNGSATTTSRTFTNTRNSSSNNKNHQAKQTHTSFSAHALNYAVERHLPGFKVQCTPKVNDIQQGKEIIKALFEAIGTDVKRMNRLDQSSLLGFDHWYVVAGDLMCFTRSVELFVYLCDITHFPQKLLDTSISPVLPNHLPPDYSIILKFVPNDTSCDELMKILSDKYHSIFALEEMKGTYTQHYRHVRLDVKSKEEYEIILNAGAIPIEGQLISVSEFLAPPRLLICSRCNVPGHVKKDCHGPYDRCRRCGNDRTKGEHMNCTIKCHHCDGDHLSTDFRCAFISDCKRQLIDQLCKTAHRLPPQVQLFIPAECRTFGDKSGRVLANQTPLAQQQRQIRQQRQTTNTNAWPAISTEVGGYVPQSFRRILPSASDLINEIKKTRDEYNNLKLEYQMREKQLQIKYEQHLTLMNGTFNLITQQIQQQNDAIEQIFKGMNDVLPIVVSTLGVIRRVASKMSAAPTNEEEKSEWTDIERNVLMTENFLTDKSTILMDHQKQLSSLTANQDSASFSYSPPNISPFFCDVCPGSPKDKAFFSTIVNEWNARLSVSQICKQWKTDRPNDCNSVNLNVLLYNVQGLNSHIPDLIELISYHQPHVCLLTGIGAAAKRLPHFPEYIGLSQPGTNSFGGVAILHHQSIKCSVVEREVNYLLIELLLCSETVLIGVVYVPPGSRAPIDYFEKCVRKPFFIFGDYNAKHVTWNCEKNNTSGIHLSKWIEDNGYDVIAPNKPTSRRSDSVIDFGIAHDGSGWNSEVLECGTSDHRPIIFQSPIAITNDHSVFRRTNWPIFSFFLSAVYQYWTSVVYNLDEQTFFELFSSFLAALSDRCSVYEPITRYRPPWPPALVLRAKEVNRCRRAYRRCRSIERLERYLRLKEIFIDEREKYMQEKREKKMAWTSQGNNIWKAAKHVFRAYSPPFRGLTTTGGRITDPKEIVDILADFYEDHFSKPTYDPANGAHCRSIAIYEQIAQLPALALDAIKMEEGITEWRKLRPKKSTDSTETSAFMLKQFPIEYTAMLTVLFNKCAKKGEFFNAGKHAKLICLSKDGIYPAVNRLRPISLLPNLAKLFERIIHRRILEWCVKHGIFVDEQSGFTPGRRLQTRIVSLIEDLRLTVAANNRPALCVFVDFLSAFDKLWFPALIANLKELDMPEPMIKWIFSWLQDRSFSIHFGMCVSRVIQMCVGAPQGSILAATLFRLHVHFLPSFFFGLIIHMFADDLALVIQGALEKRFSMNIVEIEERARYVLLKLKEFAINNILPVNVSKTKGLLVHNVVSPSRPTLEYDGQKIDYVKAYKYLGVTITCKLGWGDFIRTRLTKIRQIYRGMRTMFYSISRDNIPNRRQVFLSFALPHFLWLVGTWFFYSENQKRLIEHVYCSGLRIVYSLDRFDDETTYVLSQEKTLRDYVFTYWTKFTLHLERASEALAYQQSWSAFLIAKTSERGWYRDLGMRKNSVFLQRLARQATHTRCDWLDFSVLHASQLRSFALSPLYINMFIYKYFLPP